MKVWSWRVLMLWTRHAWRKKIVVVGDKCGLLTQVCLEAESSPSGFFFILSWMGRWIVCVENFYRSWPTLDCIKVSQYLFTIMLGGSIVRYKLTADPGLPGVWELPRDSSQDEWALNSMCQELLSIKVSLCTFLPICVSSAPEPKISVRLSARCFKLLATEPPGA